MSDRSRRLCLAKSLSDPAKREHSIAARLAHYASRRAVALAEYSAETADQPTPAAVGAKTKRAVTYYWRRASGTH